MSLSLSVENKMTSVSVITSKYNLDGMKNRMKKWLSTKNYLRSQNDVFVKFCRQVFLLNSCIKTLKDRSKDRRSRSYDRDRIADVFSNWDWDRERDLNF